MIEGTVADALVAEAFQVLPEKERMRLARALLAVKGDSNARDFVLETRTFPKEDRPRIRHQQLSETLPVNGGLPGAQNHPAARLDDSTLRAQGLHVGFSLTY